MAHYQLTSERPFIEWHFAGNLIVARDNMLAVWQLSLLSPKQQTSKLSSCLEFHNLFTWNNGFYRKTDKN